MTLKCYCYRRAKIIVHFLMNETLCSQRAFGQCVTGFKFDGPLLKRSAGDLPRAGSLEIPKETGSGEVGREAAVTDVGEAIAVGVSAIRVGMPGEIGSETVGRREAGAFADKDEAEVGPKMETDGVANGHPALLHQSEWGNSPPCTEELREKMCKQGNGIAFDRHSRETVCDSYGQVAGAGLNPGNGVGVECPAKNRLAEIGSTVGGVGLKLQDRNRGFSKDGQFGVEALREGMKIKLGMDRVARPSVGELKIKHLRRGDAMAGSGQGYSGRREIAKSETGSWDEIGHRIDQFSDGSCI